MQICIHRKDNSPKPVNHWVWPWRRGPMSNLTTLGDSSQPMISYRLVSHCKPLRPIINALWAVLNLPIFDLWPWRIGTQGQIWPHIKIPSQCFPMQTTRTKKNSELSALLKFGYPCLTLKEGPQGQISSHQKIPSPWLHTTNLQDQ